MQLFVIDSNATITHVAGTGTVCSDAMSTCGDGGPAQYASLTNPFSAALLLNSDIVVGDAGINRVRLISHADGTISTLIGSGTAGYSLDYTPAANVEMNTGRSSICAVTVDPISGEVLYSGERFCPASVSSCTSTSFT